MPASMSSSCVRRLTKAVAEARRAGLRGRRSRPSGGQPPP
jgi:hypothetical protein